MKDGGSEIRGWEHGRMENGEWEDGGIRDLQDGENSIISKV